MKKPKFTEILKYRQPLLTTMIMDNSPQDCICRIRNATYDGAQAIAIHMEYLNREYHNYKDLKRIFAYADDRPLYTMNYRLAGRHNASDEELVQAQLIAAEAGASMVDITGDIYEQAPVQLCMNPRTIDRQRALIDQFHKRDCEVLMSSHTFKFMNADETLSHCNELIRRGADMVKIAMCATEYDQMEEVFHTTIMMKKELKVPFIHICMGQYGKLHRVIGPILGSALTLSIQEYVPQSNKEQPITRCARAVYDNLEWRCARNDQLGTLEVMPDEEDTRPFEYGFDQIESDTNI